MGFFDNIGSKISSAGNQVSSKVKDSGEQLKLNNEIHGLKVQITQHYQKLGEMYYIEHRGTHEPQNYEAECDVIDQLNNLINEKESKINDIKTQITCPVCGKSIAADSAFCPNCGTPITHNNQVPQEADESAKMVCPNCGAALPDGAVFCTSCGARIIQEESQNQDEN